MTFDETLYGRGSDDGDDLSDSESFEDVVDDEEEELEDEELEDEEEEQEEQELGYAEDEGVAPSASRAQREEEASKAQVESASPAKKPAKKAVKTTAAKKSAAQTPAKKAAKKAAVKSVTKKAAKKAGVKTAIKKAAKKEAKPAKKATKKAVKKAPKAVKKNKQDRAARYNWSEADRDGLDITEGTGESFNIADLLALPDNPDPDAKEPTDLTKKARGKK